MKKRLAVVDDNPAIAEFIQNVAEPMGLDVSAYSRGDAFLETLDGEHPDLLILDLMMPGTDGMEMLNTLSQKKLACPLYIMSGVDAPVLEAARFLGQAGQLDMRGAIAKPVRAAELRTLLNAGLETAG